MSTGNPLLDYLLLQAPVVVFMFATIWAIVRTGDLVPGKAHKEMTTRCELAESELTKARAENRAIELLAEQLRRAEARGDEWKEMARTGVITAQRATAVAETAQKLNSGGD